MHSISRTLALLTIAAAPSLATAQVAIHPSQIEPSAWERIAVRVVNQGQSPWVEVEVEVPDVVAILGVHETSRWTVLLVPGTDTSAQRIAWSGGRVNPGEYREFVFLGRLAADARRRELYFPVRLTDAEGSTVTWRRGGDGAAPRMMITGSTRVSSWGAFALAGAAFGLAALAFALAVRRLTP